MPENLTSDNELKRTLTLPLLIFYGLGTTIGAGIYVLIGAAAGHAGLYAPLAFIVAAIGIAPTAISYAELSGRMPVSAGEAAYVKNGFRSNRLSTITGLLVILSGLIASATIALGCAGYLGTFIDLSLPILALAVILVMGAVAIWGIMESVILTAVFTLIEAGGLILLIYFGLSSEYVDLGRVGEMIPSSLEPGIWAGIMNAGMLAVFAFIGFEDMVNVAEETKNPRKTLPKGVFLTLIITTILYTLVTAVAVLSIDPAELSQSEAPLSDVFQKLTGGSTITISVIAIFATANTILVQFIMVSRVIYGMSKKSQKFSSMAKVNARTRTPLNATLLVIGTTIIFALAFPLESLATVTSQVILLVWAMANAALVMIKLRKTPAPVEGFVTPIWVPIIGTLFCAILLLLSMLA